MENGKQTTTIIIKRIFVYCLGMLVMALGVSFAKLADLGMSPVNSLPYVLSEIFPQLTMGNFVIVIYCIFIVVQFALDPKSSKLIKLLQLPCTVIFGFFTDFTNWLVPFIMPGAALLTADPIMEYGIRVIYLIISMIILPFGILLYLSADLPLLPGEGVTLSISRRLLKPLPTVKTYVDSTLAMAALVLSILYFHGFHGVREGTILAAFGYGRILGFYSSFKQAIFYFIYGRKEET